MFYSEFHFVQNNTVKKFPPVPGQNGIFAFMPTDRADINCNEAVVYWGSAAKNFLGGPPVYTTEQPIYKNVFNTSLVALYNPGRNPTVDCIAFTCTVKKKEGAHGFLCLSAPAVFKANEPPFT